MKEVSVASLRLLMSLADCSDPNTSADLLAALIAHLLGMSASFRPVPLVDGLLWDLGTPRLGRKSIPVLFAVRLGEIAVREQIRRELGLRRGVPSALVLASGRGIASDMTVPTVSRIVPVLDGLDIFPSWALLMRTIISGVPPPQTV